MQCVNSYNLTVINSISENEDQEFLNFIKAVKKGETSVVKKLIEAGVDINKQDEDGYTALMWAAKIGYKMIVEHLMSIDNLIINKQNTDGYTGLMLAVKYGRNQIAMQLIDDLMYFGYFHDLNNIKDHTGNTVLMLASKYGRSLVVQELVRCYWEYLPLIDLDAKNHNGDTALMLAAANGHEIIVDALADCSYMDLDVTNKNGDTALSLAIKNGYSDIGYILACDYGATSSPVALKDNDLSFIPALRC